MNMQKAGGCEGLTHRQTVALGGSTAVFLIVLVVVVKAKLVSDYQTDNTHNISSQNRSAAVLTSTLIAKLPDEPAALCAQHRRVELFVSRGASLSLLFVVVIIAQLQTATATETKSVN